jgi:peptidoglycan/LPS O-acetylase OafA/YrhL
MRNKSSTSKQLFYSLDGIRGVAAILVALRHITDFIWPIDFQETYLAVDVFFVLSGVVIANAYEHRLKTDLSVLKFIWIRLVRFYPLYICGIMITAAAAYLAAAKGIQTNLDIHMFPEYLVLAVLFLPILSQAISFPIVGPGWSLSYELFVNIFYALIARKLTLRLASLIIMISAIGMAAGLFFTGHHTLDVGWTQDTLVLGVFRVCYSFFAGILIYRFFSSSAMSSPEKAWARFVPWGILAAFALLLTANPSPHIQPFYDFAAVSLVFPALVGVSLWFQPAARSARVFRFFGTISYALYVLHYPIYRIAANIVKHYSGVPVRTYAPWAGLIFIALMVVLAWLMDTVYDSPVRHFLLKGFSIKPKAQRVFSKKIS